MPLSYDMYTEDISNIFNLNNIFHKFDQTYVIMQLGCRIQYTHQNRTFVYNSIYLNYCVLTENNIKHIKLY